MATPLGVAALDGVPTLDDVETHFAGLPTPWDDWEELFNDAIWDIWFNPDFGPLVARTASIARAFSRALAQGRRLPLQFDPMAFTWNGGASRFGRDIVGSLGDFESALRIMVGERGGYAANVFDTLAVRLALIVALLQLLDVRIFPRFRVPRPDHDGFQLLGRLFTSLETHRVRPRFFQRDVAQLWLNTARGVDDHLFTDDGDVLLGTLRQQWNAARAIMGETRRLARRLVQYAYQRRPDGIVAGNAGLQPWEAALEEERARITADPSATAPAVLPAVAFNAALDTLREWTIETHIDHPLLYKDDAWWRTLEGILQRVEAAGPYADPQPGERHPAEDVRRLLTALARYAPTDHVVDWIRDIVNEWHEGRQIRDTDLRTLAPYIATFAPYPDVQALLVPRIWGNDYALPKAPGV